MIGLSPRLSQDEGNQAEMVHMIGVLDPGGFYEKAAGSPTIVEGKPLTISACSHSVCKTGYVRQKRGGKEQNKQGPSIMSLILGIGKQFLIVILFKAMKSMHMP